MQNARNIWKGLLFIISSFMVLSINDYSASGEVDMTGVNIAHNKIEVYSWDPMSKRKVLPHDTMISYSLLSKGIELSACRKEFKSFSFILRGIENNENVKIISTDLMSDNGNILPSDQLNIRLVKCWYQAAENTIENRKNKVLVPELLLYDDSMIKVDDRLKKNYIKSYKDVGDKIGSYYEISSQNDVLPEGVIIRDSNSLLPFDLYKGENKQVWGIIRIPDNSKSGIYKGMIKAISGEVNLCQIPIVLRVHSFDLSPSVLEYGIYYRGKLISGEQKGINSEWKTVDQYSTELKNIYDHGIYFPTIYQELKDGMIIEALDIRKSINLPNENIYVYGTRTEDVDVPEIKKKIIEEVTTWLEYASLYSYKNVYIYGMDQATGEDLLKQLDVWMEIQAMGAKIFSACSGTAADIAGNRLDKPIYAGNYMFEKSNLYKLLGKKKPVLSYDNPQVGIENPWLYRYKYGLKLLVDGYAGAMPYAYQDSFGHIWNDFDHDKFRDHVFAYPTSTGVIDTVQWEGFREAVTDIRYISTLLRVNPSNGEYILNWLRDNLSVDVDLSDIRNQIITTIEDSRQNKLIAPESLRYFIH